MCIIVAKPKSIALPSDEIIKNCWDGNSDGAGIMYVREGDKKVNITKGFLTLDEFKSSLKALNLQKEDLAVLHFRIATTGGISPGNTHPFPITNRLTDLKKLNMATSVGIAHNGVLSIKPKLKNVSDTQEMIRTVLYSKDIREALLRGDKKAHKLIKKQDCLSRFCVLTPSHFTLLGRGWIKEKGISYSGGAFRVKKTDYSKYYRKRLICPECKYLKDYCKCDRDSRQLSLSEAAGGLSKVYCFRCKKWQEEGCVCIISNAPTALDSEDFPELKAALVKFLADYCKIWQGEDTKWNDIVAFEAAFLPFKETFEKMMNEVMDIRDLCPKCSEDMVGFCPECQTWTDTGYDEGITTP